MAIYDCDCEEKEKAHSIRITIFSVCDFPGLVRAALGRSARSQMARPFAGLERVQEDEGEDEDEDEGEEGGPSSGGGGSGVSAEVAGGEQFLAC